MVSGLTGRRHLGPFQRSSVLQAVVSRIPKADHAGQPECEGGDIERFRSGSLHSLTDTGSSLMTPFLEFILINTHTIYAYYHCMLYASTTVTDATVIFYRRVVVLIPESLHTKGMRILAIGGNGRSLQRTALPDEDRLEFLQNLVSPRAVCLYVKHILYLLRLTFGEPGAVRHHLRIRLYPQILNHASGYFLPKDRVRQRTGRACASLASTHECQNSIAVPCIKHQTVLRLGSDAQGVPPTHEYRAIGTE
jgi:hypothetical protein